MPVFITQAQFRQAIHAMKVCMPYVTAFYDPMGRGPDRIVGFLMMLSGARHRAGPKRIAEELKMPLKTVEAALRRLSRDCDVVVYEGSTGTDGHKKEEAGYGPRTEVERLWPTVEAALRLVAKEVPAPEAAPLAGWQGSDMPPERPGDVMGVGARRGPGRPSNTELALRAIEKEQAERAETVAPAEVITDFRDPRWVPPVTPREDPGFAPVFLDARHPDFFLTPMNAWRWKGAPPLTGDYDVDREYELNENYQRLTNEHVRGALRDWRAAGDTVEVARLRRELQARGLEVDAPDGEA